METFLKNLKRDDILDIYLVFTDSHDAANFQHSFVRKLIIDSPGRSFIVVYKKLEALKYINKNLKYDYFLLCDADMDWIFNGTSEEVYEKINSWWESKHIFGGPLSRTKIREQREGGQYIQRVSLGVFSPKDQQKLKFVEDYYYWFSDIPIFKASTLDRFFNTISQPAYWSPSHYDQIMYSNYLLLYEGFTFVDHFPATHHPWSLEMLMCDMDCLYRLKKLGYLSTWAFAPQFDNHKEFYKREKTLIAYHSDRKPIPWPTN